ncbi:MAG: hypothetical protein K8R48_00140 [Alphaproteobacteria bacterium]|nr:hypothetical protein [Alphaproteobacteria bacterium]
MAIENNPEKKPLGDKIRDLINPALEDERKNAIQLKILDEIFEEITQVFPKIMEQNYSDIFNKAAQINNPADKNNFIIKTITLQGSKGRKEYSPTLPLGLPIVTAFTSFSAEDIKTLPGYVKLHLAARTHNVALKITGLTADESKGGGGAALIIDGMKTYEQGAMENYNLYPNLPEKPPVPFDAQGPGKFRL